MSRGAQRGAASNPMKARADDHGASPPFRNLYDARQSAIVRSV